MNYGNCGRRFELDGRRRIEMKLANFIAASGLLLCLVHDVFADSTFILATGRRDPRIYAIDLEQALKLENNNTPNAIVSRSKVALDRLDGRPLGDPANIVVSEDRKRAYIVNHHGSIDNNEFLQHGGRGTIAIMNIRKMIRPENDDTAEALVRHIDSGHFGSVGLVLLPDMFIIGNAESHLTEDGGNRITFVDRRTGSLRGEVELALGPGNPKFPCPNFPVPFVSPNGPPSPVPLLSPDPAWGCFPDTNGITLGHGSDGKSYLFAANGGTNDVSVIDLEQALAGNKTPEIIRIPTQIGPWASLRVPTGGGSSLRIEKVNRLRLKVTPSPSSTSIAHGSETRMPRSRACLSARVIPVSRHGRSFPRLPPTANS